MEIKSEIKISTMNGELTTEELKNLFVFTSFLMP